MNSCSLEEPIAILRLKISITQRIPTCTSLRRKMKCWKRGENVDFDRSRYKTGQIRQIQLNGLRYHTEATKNVRTARSESRNTCIRPRVVVKKQAAGRRECGRLHSNHLWIHGATASSTTGNSVKPTKITLAAKPTAIMAQI